MYTKVLGVESYFSLRAGSSLSHGDFSPVSVFSPEVFCTELRSACFSSDALPTESSA